MPTSDVLNIPAVLHAVISFNPQSVLDIGCGFGKYGALLREYTDVAARRYTREQWQVKIVGIEGFKDYDNPLWHAVYDQVHIGDATSLLPTLGEFDVVLIADVIEHFEKDRAQQLVKAALSKCKALVISTPHEFYAQGAEFGNEYERHRCHWTAADTPSGYHCHTVPMLACDLFIITKKPVPARQMYPTDWSDLLYLRSRRNLRKLGPVAYPLAMMARAINNVVS